MVAHAHGGAAGRRGVIGFDQIHQSRARPVGGCIKTGLARLGADLAVGGERGVDQPRVERTDRVVVELQPVTYRQRQIGDEHIRLAHQAIQHIKPLGLFQVEAQAALAAVVEFPGVVAFGHRQAGGMVSLAVGIAFGRFDLDDVCTEISHRRSGCGRRNETRAVDDLQPGEGSLGSMHGVSPDRLSRQWQAGYGVDDDRNGCLSQDGESHRVSSINIAYRSNKQRFRETP